MIQRTRRRLSRRHHRRQFGGHAGGNARQRFAKSALSRCAEVSDDYFSFQASQSGRAGETADYGRPDHSRRDQEVVLDVDGPSAPIKDPMGKAERIGASATTKINRQDFGVTALPGVVGDEITITIDTELIQPPK